MYREVTMIEVKEVLRLRGEGLPEEADRRAAGARSEDCAALSPGGGNRRRPRAGDDQR
jgi:hypothetical protein